MGLIATAHHPHGFTQEEIAHMLLVHACMERGPLWVAVEPADGCDEDCGTCQRLREGENA